MRFIVFGIFFIFIGVFVFFFYPVLKAEYSLFVLDNDHFRTQILAVQKTIRQLTPVDEQFGIVINKIGATGKILDSVDYNGSPLEYTLLNGLVHQSDSAYPGEVGNMVIISQTPGDWYKYTRSNPEFYLVYKLKPKDIIQVFYRGNRYDYEVLNSYTGTEKQLKSYTAVSNQKLLTLISGWPPGTTFFQLVVQAKLTE